MSLVKTKCILQTPVLTLFGLIDLAKNKRSVYLIRMGKVLPAAFVQNWPGRLIQYHMDAGMFLCKPKEKDHGSISSSKEP